MKLPLLSMAAALTLTTLAAPALADGSYSSSLYENEYLFRGQRVVADGCARHLEMQADGNLVLYASPGETSVLWSADTRYRDRDGISDGAEYAVMQSDGNFVAYDYGHFPMWAAASGRSNYIFESSNRLWVQNDGNVVVYDDTLRFPQWWTGTNGESLGSSPCEMRSSITSIQENTNRGGSDFTHFDTSSSWTCAESCVGNASCNAFTWVPPGLQGPEGVCWLKSGIPATTYYPGMRSGYIRH